MTHKHIISYDEEDIYSQHELQRILKSTEAYLVLWDVREFVRQEIKYGDYTENDVRILEKVQDFLYCKLEERGIDIDSELD